MGLKSLLFGGHSSASSTSSSVKGHPLLRTQAYDSAVALEQPVRGSYPVAGNGPNVLDEIRVARARQEELSRASSTRQGTADTLAGVKQKRANTLDKPRIGKPGSGQDSEYEGLNVSDGRTRSGFTTKSPPIFSNANRRSSFDSPNRKSIPPLPSHAANFVLRDVKTYQPRKAADDGISFTIPTPSFAEHQRSDSSASHRAAHVDLLEAHSHLRPSQESTQHRTKASGLRNYGEDVADRNIKDYGGRRAVKNKRASSQAFDVNASEFSYLKSIYETDQSPVKCKAPKSSAGTTSETRAVERPFEQRTFSDSSAAPEPLRLGQQPQNRASNSDAIGPPVPSKQPEPSKPSLRSRATAESARSRSNGSSGASSPATFVPGPLRSRPYLTSSTRSRPFPSTANSSRSRDDRSYPPNDAYDRSVRARSPLSDSSGSVYSNDADGNPTTPPIPDRGRNRRARDSLPPAVTTPLPSPVKISKPVPVSIISSSSSILSTKSTNSKARPAARKSASVSFSDEPPQSILPAKYPPPSLKDRRRTMSTEIANGQPLSHRPKSGSVSNGSPFPSNGFQSSNGFQNSNGSRHDNTDSTSRQHTDSTSRHNAVPSNTAAPKRKDMLVENSKESISLKGIVDISNTVDTTVTTKKLPAVVHEHVTPTQLTIREEAITREIHHHDVYHRILPVIETIILPTKHFIYAPDRTFLIEIPEHDVPQYTGRPLESVNQGWKLVRITDAPTPVTPVSVEKVQKPSIARKSIPNSGSEQFLDQFQSLGPYIHAGNQEGSQSSAAHVEEAQDESVQKHEQLSTVSSQIAENSTTQGRNPGPVLTSKRTYMTKEGFPRTEYFWRHPPVFEDVQGRTQPIYMRNVIGGARLNSDFRSSSDEEDAAGKNYGAANPEGELFRDSGYGEYTALPGISKNADGGATTARSVGNGHVKSASTSSPLSGGQGGNMHYKSASTSSPLAGAGTGATKSILKNEQQVPSPIATHSPIGSHKPLPASPLASSPLTSHGGSGARIVDDEPGDRIQLGRVLDDERQPRSSGVGSAEKDHKTGEATNFLRRLKEKRLSGDSSIFRSWSKNRSRQSQDMGRVSGEHARGGN